MINKFNKMNQAWIIAGLAMVLIICAGGGTYRNEYFFKSTGLIYEKECTGILGENEIKAYEYVYYDWDGEDTYITNPRFKVTKAFLNPEETALVIMDPWINNPSEEINHDVQNITTNYLIPIAEHAIKKKMKILIISNLTGSAKYNSQIDQKLQSLIDMGSAELLNHFDMNTTDKFGRYLAEHNILNLVYTGFATQMCLLFRPSGIMSVYYNENMYIKMYCIPDATMAAISVDKKKNTQMRNDIITMLANNQIIQCILFEDFIKY